MNPMMTAIIVIMKVIHSSSKNLLVNFEVCYLYKLGRTKAQQKLQDLHLARVSCHIFVHEDKVVISSRHITGVVMRSKPWGPTSNGF
jgi:hypothetical protein